MDKRAPHGFDRILVSIAPSSTHLIMKLLFLLLSLTALAHGADRPPNIVFILADDLGWADTTLYGKTSLYRTPNLERLAKRGMTYTRAYSASPLCSPTRASILTGLSPARLGLTSPNCHLPEVVLKASAGTSAAPDEKSTNIVPVTRLATDYFTLPKALKAAGYVNGHFGKWHLGPEPYSPLQHNFDIDLPHTPGPGPAGSFVAPWKYPNFLPKSPEEHIEDRMAQEASAFIEKNKAVPFFLNYWMFSVHAPFDAKKFLIEDYRKNIDPEQAQRSPTYAAMVHSMDDAVGTLLDTLDRLNLTEKTIIVFYSDNGGNMYDEIDNTTPTSNAPLRGGKATMYEGGTRVPCVISWPGKTPAASTNDTVIQSTDFLPTFAEALSLTVPKEQVFDSISILPTFEKKPLARDAIFTYFPHNPPVPDWLPPSISVHNDDWKLIRIFHGGEAGAHRWKLFHLSDDLGETKDLAASETERVKKMDAMIEAFLVRTQAVRPAINPKFDPTKYDTTKEGIGKMRQKKSAAKPTKSQPSLKADIADPTLEGWRARQCDAVVKNGIVHLSNMKQAFLGVGYQNPEAYQITFRIKCDTAGSAAIEYLNNKVKPAISKRFAYELTSAEWQNITVKIPAATAGQILRIHMPEQAKSAQIDLIEITHPTQHKRWDFEARIQK